MRTCTRKHAHTQKEIRRSQQSKEESATESDRSVGSLEEVLLRVLLSSNTCFSDEPSERFSNLTAKKQKRRRF